MNASERVLDLLVSRATEGLSDFEKRELDTLQIRHPEIDDDTMDLAAAAVDIEIYSRSHELEEMPASVKQRLFALAETQTGIEVPEEQEVRRSPLASNLGWMAAAAMLLLAIWSPWKTPPSPVVPEALTPEQARENLIREGGALIRVSWNESELEAYATVEGDVVWSQARQAGFMRLKGLPANTPTEGQYQLWIVDPSRDARPIDGGVFDIEPGSGEVVVPIDAKLQVVNPQAFAITYEQPGGVVVSEGPLLVVAPV